MNQLELRNGSFMQCPSYARCTKLLHGISAVHGQRRWYSAGNKNGTISTNRKVFVCTLGKGFRTSFRSYVLGLVVWSENFHEVLIHRALCKFTATIFNKKKIAFVLRFSISRKYCLVQNEDQFDNIYYPYLKKKVFSIRNERSTLAHPISVIGTVYFPKHSLKFNIIVSWKRSKLYIKKNLKIIKSPTHFMSYNKSTKLPIESSQKPQLKTMKHLLADVSTILFEWISLE